MTKKELLILAKDVDLMDKLNSISGLLEVNRDCDKQLIEELMEDILDGIKSKKAISAYSREYCLSKIKEKDEQAYEELKNQRFAAIRYEYRKLCENVDNKK